MKDGKFPGNDGVTKEFYMCFFDKLGPLLRNSLNFSLEKGEVSTSQKQVVTTLIEKKDRDRRFIKNWRPISLLNVDFKIASKVSVCRLKKVVGKIIEPDQTAYIKDRNIHESTRLIQDILYYIENSGEERILFTVDIEKAFDSVDHSFLFAVLKNSVSNKLLSHGSKLY